MSAERSLRSSAEHRWTIAKRYIETIEELTGRKDVAFLSQAHVEPDITMEISS